MEIEIQFKVPKCYNNKDLIRPHIVAQNGHKRKRLKAMVAVKRFFSFWCYVTHWACLKPMQIALNLPAKHQTLKPLLTLSVFASRKLPIQS